ncbi:hypothetical protein M422DRAFT_77889, partial [Sphaerobolus stellatus SS14]
KFTYMNMLWLRHPEQLADLSLDMNYDPMRRYDSVDAKLQGQLQDLRDIIPRKFHKEFENHIFWKEVRIGMQQQRSNGISQIRLYAGPAIFDCKASDLATVTGRMRFKEEIGFVEEADGTTRYKALCPILYKEYEGRHDKTKIFLNPALFQAQHVLSADNQLQPIGASTNIPYQDDMEYYLKYLNKGLLTEDRHVLAIFQAWNDHFYPNS